MKKIYQFLCKAELVLCGIGFMFLVVFVFLAAVLRLFHFSMSWNIDLAMLLLAWTAFLGADIAWRNGQLVGIDIVTRRLPKKIQAAVQILIYLAILCVLVLVVTYGLRLAWTERLRKYQSIPLPYSLVTLSLICAAVSMFFSTIIKIKRCITGKNGGES
jgi:TRAP-type C4-dicarboxylate transport system permease small subunit